MASKSKSSGTVVIIDDNDGNRELCRFCLEAKNFLVHSAINGKQGLEVIRQTQPDVVLLDIMMPVMNGFQVLEHLKADSSIQETPVLVQSASTQTATVIKALELGANDFLKKPFEVDELVVRVKKLIECKQTRDALVNAAVELVKHQQDIDAAGKPRPFENSVKRASSTSWPNQMRLSSWSRPYPAPTRPGN